MGGTMEINVPEKIRGLIFDCDGTLVDSMPLHAKAWEYAITNAGGKWDFDFIFSKKGMMDKDIVRLYNEHFAASLDPEEIAMSKHKFFREHNKEVKPIEPVMDVVKRYHKILPLAVASGSRKEDVHFQLDRLQIKDLFDVILTADDNIKPKPAPDIFIEAAKRINVPPGLCQVFEDGDLGLKAARTAGMLATDVRTTDNI
jgi:HAD superfamily hydrolase (TIGR01509 family)